MHTQSQRIRPTLDLRCINVAGHTKECGGLPSWCHTPEEIHQSRHFTLFVVTLLNEEDLGKKLLENQNESSHYTEGKYFLYPYLLHVANYSLLYCKYKIMMSTPHYVVVDNGN